MKIEASKLVRMFSKVVAAGVLAGAVLTIAPQKAEAQQIGVQFGFGQGYGAPVYGPVYGRGYFDDRGFYAERRREEFRRHERWERERRFDGRGGYWR